MGLLLLNGESGLNPRTLFANNEQGLWLDPSQMSTLYQDSNGVTPCTAAGDPVGLILDQSRGGLSQIGADLVTNGTFAADSDWTKGANWTIGSGVATKTGGAANNLTQTIGSTAAAWYRISLDVTRSAGTLTVSLGTSGTTYAITATGSYTFFILAGSGTQTLTLAGDSSFAGTVDNVAVRNVPGNHAYQTTSSARPTLARIPSSGRRNLLTYSEDLSNAIWVGYQVTKSTGQFLETAVTDEHAISQNIDSLSGATPFSITVEIKGINRSWCRVRSRNTVFSSTAGGWFNLIGDGALGASIATNGSFTSRSITSIGDGWYRIKVEGITHTNTSGIGVSITGASADSNASYAGNTSNGLQIRNVQIEQSATATSYQKVGSTYDVTESGFADLWHGVFDGSDDSLVTNSVDFSGTDEMTVIAGVRKLSDAARGTVCELTATSASNNGAFHLTAPNAASATYAFESKGTALTDAVASSVTAPLTSVISGSSDISGDSNVIRVNGSQSDSDTGDQGTGNYSNAILYIGRRGGTTLPYNGHLYQLIIRGKTTPTGKLLEAERFTARKTGVTGI